MASGEPKPNPKPEEEDINDPKRQEENFDRDGRERYPNEQADDKTSDRRK